MFRQSENVGKTQVDDLCPKQMECSSRMIIGFAHNMSPCFYLLSRYRVWSERSLYALLAYVRDIGTARADGCDILLMSKRVYTVHWVTLWSPMKRPAACQFSDARELRITSIKFCENIRNLTTKIYKLMKIAQFQCFSTAGPRPDTGPWHQLYRAARSSPGICLFSFLSSFHE